MELTLYTHPMSRGRIARWMLEEIGQPYETKLVSFGPDMKSDAFRTLNPMGKVPVLKHGEAIVTECAAICAYLADAFPQAGLAPTGVERAAYMRWFFFAAGPLESAVSNRSLGVEVSEEKSRMVGYGSYDLVLDTLEKALSDKPYIAGERFTAVDVYLASQLAFGMMFGTIAPRPVFEAYMARVTSRDAAVRARALDDALLAEMKAKG